MNGMDAAAVWKCRFVSLLFPLFPFAFAFISMKWNGSENKGKGKVKRNKRGTVEESHKAKLMK